MSGLDFVLAFLGGGIGSLARWLMGLVVGKCYHGPFPLGTFLINVLGAFLIGFLTVFFSFEWTERFGHLVNTIFLTGILGGFTTFSAMKLDTSKLLHDQKVSLALVYLLCTVACGLIVAILGGALAWRLL